MTPIEIKEICEKKGIGFIPHHACACCNKDVGWYLFGRFYPYEVAFSPSCWCSSYDTAYEDSWQEISDWVCDNNGNLRDNYKELLTF